MKKDDLINIIGTMRLEVDNQPDFIKTSRIPGVPELLQVYSLQTERVFCQYADFMNMQFFDTYCRFEIFDEQCVERIDEVKKREIFLPYLSIFAIERLSFKDEDSGSYLNYRMILSHDLEYQHQPLP